MPVPGPAMVVPPKGGRPVAGLHMPAEPIHEPPIPFMPGPPAQVMPEQPGPAAVMASMPAGLLAFSSKVISEAVFVMKASRPLPPLPPKAFELAHPASPPPKELSNPDGVMPPPPPKELSPPPKELFGECRLLFFSLFDLEELLFGGDEGASSWPPPLVKYSSTASSMDPVLSTKARALRVLSSPNIDDNFFAASSNSAPDNLEPLPPLLPPPPA